MATINIYEGAKKQSVVQPAKKGNRTASKVVSTSPATKKKQTRLSKFSTKAASFAKKTVRKVSPIILK